MNIHNKSTVVSSLQAGVGFFFSLGSTLALLFFLQYMTGFILLAFVFQPTGVIGGVHASFHSAHQSDISYVTGVTSTHRSVSIVFMCLMMVHALRNILFGVMNSGSMAHMGVGYLLYISSCLLCFTGYSLPRSNVSYHALVVIISLVGSCIPFYSVGFSRFVYGAVMPSGGETCMMRLEILHIAVAHFVLFLILVHLHMLHKDQSSAGIMEETQGNVALYGSYLLMDILLFLWANVIILQIVYCMRDRVGTSEQHWIEADPLMTPNHLRPEVYFLHFYALLRIVHVKMLGILYMGVMMSWLLWDLGTFTGGVECQM